MLKKPDFYHTIYWSKLQGLNGWTARKYTLSYLIVALMRCSLLSGFGLACLWCISLFVFKSVHVVGAHKHGRLPYYRVHIICDAFPCCGRPPNWDRKPSKTYIPLQAPPYASFMREIRWLEYENHQSLGQYMYMVAGIRFAQEHVFIRSGETYTVLLKYIYKIIKSRFKKIYQLLMVYQIYCHFTHRLI